MAGDRHGAAGSAGIERTVIGEGDAARVRELVTTRMPGYRVDTIVELGEGWDHVAFEVNSSLIVRLSKDEDTAHRASLIRREAALLDVVKVLAPPATPEPLFVLDQEGALAYLRISGTPLITLAARHRFRGDTDFAATLGGFLTRLHSLPVEPVSQLVPREEEPPAQWLEEAGETYRRIAGDVPALHQGPVARFLEAPTPSDQFIACLCHNDLGVEHVLVDQAGHHVTGIIDWSDAAITDPAHDFALIYRDLGAGPLEETLRSYSAVGADPRELHERAVFYARCAVLEDLEYGLKTGRAMYTEKSLAAMNWLFAP
jgi:aminoglycoside phosphotransferase (APT) family kinase protein